MSRKIWEPLAQAQERGNGYSSGKEVRALAQANFTTPFRNMVASWGMNIYCKIILKNLKEHMFIAVNLGYIKQYKEET